MRVLYFGAYNPHYARNSVFLSGLRQNGVTVIECHDDSPGLKKFIRLFVKHWKIRKEYDVIFVAFLGQILMPFVRFINLPFISFRSSKPIVFDAFMSLYDSNVFGREKTPRYSLRALYYWLLDWSSMHLGDRVLFDTEQHNQYVIREFGVSPDRLRKVYVGTQEEIFFPRPQQHNDIFNVLFHGTFIKSHGLEFILEAARKLQSHTDIRFVLVGDGQIRKEMEELAQQMHLSNVSFEGNRTLPQIAEYIAAADVCLGIFGKAEKIQRVIPNKVFECTAMQKAIITADTPGIRELFDEGDLYLIPVADPHAIAEAILRLKNDPSLRERFAQGGHEKLKRFATAKQLGSELEQIFQEIAKKD